KNHVMELGELEGSVWDGFSRVKEEHIDLLEVKEEVRSSQRVFEKGEAEAALENPNPTFAGDQLPRSSPEGNPRSDLRDRPPSRGLRITRLREKSSSRASSASKTLKPKDKAGSLTVLEGTARKTMKEEGQRSASSYPCQNCNSVFPTSTGLQDHQKEDHRRVHTREKPYYCEDCGRCFSRPGNLQTHRLVHSAEKRYKCAACGKSFRHYTGLKAHRLVHTDSRPYSCKDCKKTFRGLGGLRIHERSHTGARPYVCAVCGKAFKELNVLKNHGRLHSGEKPYGCEKCGKSFRQLGAYRTHQRRHTGEKPYSCSQCPKTFRHNSSLKAHVKIHTGEAPFPCPQCGRLYMHMRSLQLHSRTHGDGDGGLKEPPRNRRTARAGAEDKNK
ncbi:zinc finger protein 675-like, partial [Scleropages formosus]